MTAAGSVPRAAAGPKPLLLLHGSKLRFWPDMVPRRHWMMTLAPDAWARLLARRPDLAAEPLLATWAKLRRPLVLRRPLENDPPGEVPLGLPLPPSHGKQRIAVTLAETDILDQAPPPRLADAAAAAPAHWQETIARLLRLAPETRCFGSLAWQHRTGLAYLSPTSDLDLLWDLAADSAALLAAVETIARTAPMRIDGEVVGTHGAVQWRELRAADGSVLVKTDQAVALLPAWVFLAEASS